MNGRGKFSLHPKDSSVLLTCDCPCDGGRRDPNSVKYFKHEQGRLLSYPKYSLPYTLETIRDLSRYGFEWQYDGSQLGYVSCAFCEIRISDYPPYRLAALQHLNRNPNCPLITGKCSENVVRKNPLFVNQNLLRKVKYESYEVELMDFLENPFKSQSNPSGGLPAVVDDVKDIYDEFSRKERRLSFPDEWKYPVPVEDLVLYGFKWCGVTDHVKCTSCGIEIVNFQEGDLAGVLHSNLSPFCPYMSAF